MNLNDLSVLTGQQLVRASANTATFNGGSMDLQQYTGTLRVSQHVGAVAGTTPTLDGKIQDSADNVTFADVPGSIFPTVTAANNDQVINVDTRAVRRYIRYVGTIGGSNGQSYTFNVAALGLKKYV